MQPIRRTLPSLSYVVARSVPGNVIGCENKLPWRLSSDLKYFKETTKNHVVIMGRLTLESIGRPLPNRVNIVLSRERGLDQVDGIVWANSIESALFLADHFTLRMSQSEIFVVGGEKIYRAYKKLYNKIHLTEVNTGQISGDAHFSHTFPLTKWNLTKDTYFEKDEKNDYSFKIKVFERRNKYVRQIEVREFLREREEFENWRLDHKYILPKRVVNQEKQLELDGIYPKSV